MDVTNKGTIVINQISGRTQLFGSKTNHHYFIGLQIHTSTGGESMNPFENRFIESCLPIVSVELSMLQFAEMISSIGKGNGTPCTIRSFDGKQLPKYVLPDQKATLVDYARSVDKCRNVKIASVGAKLKEIYAANKRPTKTEMMDMINDLNAAESDESNRKFIEVETEKIFENVIADAKSQIEAHAGMYLGQKSDIPAIMNSYENEQKHIEYSIKSDTIYEKLCTRDKRNPNYCNNDNLEPRNNCNCRNCFNGTDQLVIEILRLRELLENKQI